VTTEVPETVTFTKTVPPASEAGLPSSQVVTRIGTYSTDVEVTTTVTRTVYPTQPGEQTYVTTVTETEEIPEIKTFTYS
jgi:hypothetical protein